MACNKCLHFDMCDRSDMKNCPHFKDRSQFVKVVQCKHAQQWIPVTKLLPEDLPENEGKKVIGCLVAYKPHKNGKPVSQFRQRGYSEGRGWYWMKLGAHNITHWMPMPEPPEEDQQ